MSQIFKAVTAGSLPPSVPLQFTAQDGTISVPVANNENLLARDSTINNINGLNSTASGANLTYQLTNRLHGSGTTTGAATITLATMNLGAVAANYCWEFYVSGYESTGPSGTAYSILSSVRTNGVTATLIGTSDETYVEDPALGASDIHITVSGNNVNVTAIGIAGLNIDWVVIGTYVFAS